MKFVKNAGMKYLFIILFSSLIFAQVQPIQEYRIPRGDYSADQFMKVAVLQWVNWSPAPLGSIEAAQNYKQNNMNQLASYIREAHSEGAELIVTPEFGVIGYPDIPDLPEDEDNFRNRDDIKPYVETVPGPATEFFSNLAKELKVTIHFGLAEKDAESDLYYNTVVAVGPNGEILGKYRKQHLFELEYNYLASGSENVVYDSAIGKIGLIICSDIYDSSVMNQYKEMNLSVLALSTSWTQYNSGWGYFVRAAKWVNAHVLASNHPYFPDSGVINPNGWAQSHIRQSDGLAYGFIERKN